MVRSLVSTAWRQRLVALLGVVALALTVPPAFGAPTVPAQIKSVLKIAKRADKNASAALKLAKTSATTPASSVGATGPKGDTGAAGPAGVVGATGAPGAQGDTGAAGANGAPGVKGDTGLTGATGATGATGPAGAPAPAGAGSKGFVDKLGGEIGLITGGEDILLIPTPGAGSYVVTATIEFRADGADSPTCSLSGATEFDSTTIANVYQNTRATMTLNGAATIGAGDDLKLHCLSVGDNQLKATRANLTAISVGTLTVAPTTP